MAGEMNLAPATGDPRLAVLRVSPGLLPMLGLQPFSGARSPTLTTALAPPRVLISESLWEREFGAPRRRRSDRRSGSTIGPTPSSASCRAAPTSACCRSSSARRLFALVRRPRRADRGRDLDAAAGRSATTAPEHASDLRARPPCGRRDRRAAQSEMAGSCRISSGVSGERRARRVRRAAVERGLRARSSRRSTCCWPRSRSCCSSPASTSRACSSPAAPHAPRSRGPRRARRPQRTAGPAVPGRERRADRRGDAARASASRSRRSGSSSRSRRPTSPVWPAPRSICGSWRRRSRSRRWPPSCSGCFR